MAKLVLFALVACLVSVAVAEKDFKCSSGVDAPEHWVDMTQNCTNALRNQIQMEVNASYAYLAMAAYFSRDEVNMPGFAKLFFEHASEERGHGYALMEYLLMRGSKKTNESFTKKLIVAPQVPQWAPIPDVNGKMPNGLSVLNDALDKEVAVTRSIRNVITVCENNKFNDYHLVDYLTAEFLEEQYKGQRELAGKIATLSRMMKQSDSLGQFLFDKELLA